MSEKVYSKILAFTGTLFLLLGIAGIATAQEDNQHEDVVQFKGISNLGSVSCRDVLLASGTARENLVLVFHAYILGEAKQLEFDALELATATDRFFDKCIDNPESKALATMRKAIGD